MLNEKTIEEIKEKHGANLVAVETPVGVLVFRKPRRAEFDRWMDSHGGGQTRAARELVQSCFVYPEVGGVPDTGLLGEALEAKPALLLCKNGFSDSVLTLAGLDGEEGAKSKKL